MNESTCRWMVRIGSLPGFLVAGVFFLFTLSFFTEGGTRQYYGFAILVCLVLGGLVLWLSLAMLRKGSRAAALVLGWPILGSAAFVLMMGEGGDPLAVLFFVSCSLLVAGSWLAGVIGCFIWQSRFAEKAAAAVPASIDSRPISEEAQRMIKGSMLDNDAPFFEEDGDPTPDEKAKWGMGIMTPIGLMAWAVYALATKQVVMHDKYYRPPVEITGPAVYACALALISAALFLHFHYFWGQTPKLYDYYKIPKYAALAVLIVSAFAFFILAIEGS